MNASHILDALETIDDKYIVEAKERSFINITKSSRSMKRMQTLVAVIAALLLLCGFVAYQLGWFDPVSYTHLIREGFPDEFFPCIL